MVITALIWTHTLVAGDRFFSIVFAMKARVTEKRPTPLIICIWSISLLISIPRIRIKKFYTREWSDLTETWCRDTDEEEIIWNKKLPIGCEGHSFICDMSVKSLYIIMVIICFCLLPLIFILLTYSITIYHLLRSTRSMVHRSPGGNIKRLIDSRKRVSQ